MRSDSDMEVMLRLTAIIWGWSDDNKLGITVEQQMELAERIFKKMIWGEGEPGHEEYHIKTKE